MPRPRSLTTARLVAAALVVLDSEGFAALTMRAVAKELGMSTMSLYRYVTDKDELETLVIEHVLAGVSLTVPPGDWPDRITVLLSRLREAVVAHSETVPLLLRHRHAVPASLAWIEAMLAILTEAGFTGERRVLAQRTLVSYLLGALESSYYSPVAGPGTQAMADQEQYPLLRETAAQAGKMSAETEFLSGLRIVLKGLTS